MFTDNFAELRMHRRHGPGDDSFWPSFTDIMTVIVMIFLLAMVVVMIRNNELIAQLRTAMQAEREQAALARRTASEKENLALRLIEAEQQLTLARLENLRLTSQRDRARDELAAAQTALRQAQTDIASLQAGLAATQGELAQTEESLTGTAADLERTSRERDDLKTRLDESRGRYALLQRQYQQRGEQLRTAALNVEEVSGELAALVGQYDELREKYDRLTRPARTERGKVVVEVRAVKTDGARAVTIKSPGEAAYQSVTEEEMHAELARLKEQFPNTLYVKIIFPADSGIFQDEAWRFTTDLLGKYDYYYRQPTQP